MSNLKFPQAFLTIDINNKKYKKILDELSSFFLAHLFDDIETIKILLYNQFGIKPENVTMDDKCNIIIK